MVQQLGNAHALRGVVLYHKQALMGHLRVALDTREGRLEALDSGGLGNESKGPTRQAMLAVFVQRDYLDSDMARGPGPPELTEYGPAPPIPPGHVPRHRRG